MGMALMSDTLEHELSPRLSHTHNEAAPQASMLTQGMTAAVSHESLPDVFDFNMSDELPGPPASEARRRQSSFSVSERDAERDAFT